MKKIFMFIALLYSGYSYGQIFSQHFQSGTNKSNYEGSLSQQFDWISHLGNILKEDGNNFLRFNKTGNSSSAFAKLTSLDNSFNVAVVKFKLRVSAPDVEENPVDGLARLALGEGEIPAFNVNNMGVVPDANVFAQFNFRVRKHEGIYQFYASATDFYFSGWQDIIQVANRTGNSLVYRGPNGKRYTLDTGRQDIWIGTTRVVPAGSLPVAGPATFNKFKFLVPANYANVKIDIDNIEIYNDISILSQQQEK